MTKTNIIVWQYKFVVGCQKISHACNDSNHEIINNNFLLERYGHHKNFIVKFVAVQKHN